ncbi:hypothetical protein VTH82DRAFT_2526 [Thermothelomyces myriococcoides]
MEQTKPDGDETVSALVQEAMNTNILGSPPADGKGKGKGKEEEKENKEEEEAQYGYMFTYGHRRLLFVRNLGAGVESVAQLVRDADTGEVLVRKVNARRLVHFHNTARAGPFKKPTEIRVLDNLRRFCVAVNNNPPPGHHHHHHYHRWIVDCYGHEYIFSESHDGGDGQGVVRRSWSLYHSVSYWKLCNGESAGTRWVRQGVLPPPSILARMARQVLSTLQFLYTAGPTPIYHCDTHLGNIWIHWPSASSANPADAKGGDDDTASAASIAAPPLPDFYLGDFGQATFADALPGPSPTNPAGSFDAPVGDLFKFNKGFGAIIAMADLRRGKGEPESPGYRALEELEDAIRVTIEQWCFVSAGQALPPPPDLTDLIQEAAAIENEFGRGGAADETRSAAYTQYVAEECRRAAALEREGPLVVSGSREKALKPTTWRERRGRKSSIPSDEDVEMKDQKDEEEEKEKEKEKEKEEEEKKKKEEEKEKEAQQPDAKEDEMEEVLIQIHGPWKLVKAVEGDWVIAGCEWQKFHRPNGGSAKSIADHKLGQTVRPPNPLSPTPLERFTEPFMSSHRGKPVPSFSFAPGDDTGGLNLRPSLANENTPPKDGKETEQGQHDFVLVDKPSPEPEPLVEGRVSKWWAAVYGSKRHGQKRQLEQDEKDLLNADPSVLEIEKRVKRAVTGVKEARFDFAEPFDFDLLSS